MKQILLCTFFAVLTNSSFTQDFDLTTLKIAGIDRLTVEKMSHHEYPQYLLKYNGENKPDSDYSAEIIEIVVIDRDDNSKKLKGKGKGTIKPTGDRKFEWNIGTTLTTNSAGIDFSKGARVSIKVQTNLGNYVYTNRTLSREELNDPIMLDEYGRSDPFNTTRENRVPEWNPNSVNLFLNSDLTTEFEALEDNYPDDIQANSHLQIKYKGEEEWKFDEAPVEGTNRSLGNRRYFTANLMDEHLDFTRSWEMRFSIKTTKGNYVWFVTEIHPWLINGDLNVHSKNKFILHVNRYSGKEFEDVPAGSSVDNEETSEPSAGSKSICDPGDTTLMPLTMHEVSFCVKDAKPGRLSIWSGTLLDEVDLTIGGTVYPLAKGSSISFNPDDKVATKFKIREQVEVVSGYGTFTLEANKYVQIRDELLLGELWLAEDGVVKVNGEEIACKATHSNSCDVKIKGRFLASFTLAEDMSIDAGGVEFIVPSESKVELYNGNFEKFELSKAINVNVNGNNYDVPAVEGKESIELTISGDLNYIRAGKGTSITVDGKTIPVETNSEIYFHKDGDNYTVEEFIAGGTVDVKVHKRRGKIKDDTTKPGKKVVIENGKIVKV